MKHIRWSSGTVRRFIILRVVLQIPKDSLRVTRGYGLERRLCQTDTRFPDIEVFREREFSDRTSTDLFFKTKYKILIKVYRQESRLLDVTVTNCRGEPLGDRKNEFSSLFHEKEGHEEWRVGREGRLKE